MIAIAISSRVPQYQFERAFQYLLGDLRDVQEISDVFDEQHGALLSSMRAAWNDPQRINFLLHESANALAQIGAERDARELWDLAKHQEYATPAQRESCVDRAADLMLNASKALHRWLQELATENGDNVAGSGRCLA